ncbi:MAG: vanadium-dependent haloperoxidase [Acidobacteria bacterium]|nr:vanadium-dependent haloperoxidase [Acidobacteriota bacterium]MBI3425339.1 vanadium-dependent haloperoxidase [Acidobacteriota bacterium]
MRQKNNPEPHVGVAGQLSSKAASQGRRQFLKQSTATVAAAAGLSAAPLLGGSVALAETDALGPLDAVQRARQATLRRQTAALYQSNRPLPLHLTNGDDETYASKLASFSKTLPHNNLGEADLNAYAAYLNALRSGKSEDFEKIPAGGAGKLVDPQSGLCFDLEGADIHSFETAVPPRFDSEAIAGEMAELYWRALTRDIPFSQYDSHPLTNAAVADLRRFDNYTGVDTQSLFRTPMPGDAQGYYVSQFLLKPFSLGATPFDQKYRLPVAGEDFMVAYQEWLAIQNGVAPTRRLSFDTANRYIRNGRDLGEYVHIDFSYQAFLLASLILQSFGAAALDDANPYKRATRQAGFATFGGPHLVDLIGRIAALALKAAWFQKWYVHRRIRPEEFAGRVHNKLTNAANYTINAKLLNSGAIMNVFSKYGGYLLPMAFPEGCPVHPAFPGGHATVAGACVTVLKAYFDESFVVPSPVVPSDDGATLREYNGTLTIGSELNKLASNVAYGRDTAGMHWRSDEIEGLKLGEAVAISVLSDFNACFNETFEGFTLTKFDGVTIRLSGRANQPTRVIR